MLNYTQLIFVLFIHSLFAVLMMPSSTTAEQQAKIRDMEALLRWYANALSPNEGFAGVLKPDFLGFHHNSYYASAYTPHAVHKGALIQYLLSGTTFALGEKKISQVAILSSKCSKLLVYKDIKTECQHCQRWS